MSTIDELRDSYFQECAERLVTAEEGLNDIAADAAGADTVNAVFRAIHSIKGGAGAFGLDRVKSFAHVFESALDKLRSNELQASSDVMDVMLRSLDQLNALVEEAQGQRSVSDGEEGELLAALADLAGIEPPNPGADDNAGDFDDLDFVPVQIDFGFDEPENPGWTISLELSDQAIRTANEPAPIFRELRELGEVTVTCDASHLPTLDDFNPDVAYVSFSVRLEGDVQRDAIDAIFMFMGDVATVAIEQDAVPDLPLPELPSLEGWGSGESEPAGSAGGEGLGWGEPSAATASLGTTASSFSGVSEAVTPVTAAPVAAPKAAAPPAKVAARQTIRVDLEKVDRLVNLVGEVVINQAMIEDRVKGLPKDSHADLYEALEDLVGHTRELQEAVMGIRAQPVKAVFSKIPRIVRDVAGKAGKKVRLETVGEETEIDNSVVEQLSDPLTHMIRNAVDHGVEPPDQRIALGKPEEGLVILKAEHRGGRIVISISDDGRGMDPNKLFAKAVEKGVVAPDATLSDEDKLQLVFAPGFSTAEKVTEVSGRGVGMDVVKKNIQALGGRVGILSSPGKGSTITLSLPLTLAVLDGMLVRVGHHKFVLPLTNIIETLKPNPEELRKLGGEEQYVFVRGDYVPLIRAGSLFNISRAATSVADGVTVLLETEGGRRACLLVDELLGMHQAVIKSLEQNYENVAGIAAATILGDGNVALILDPSALFELAGTRF